MSSKGFYRGIGKENWRERKKKRLHGGTCKVEGGRKRRENEWREVDI